MKTNHPLTALIIPILIILALASCGASGGSPGVSMEALESYYADSKAVDQGISGTKTVKSLCDTIGETKKAIIVLAHIDGSAIANYTFATSWAKPANITLKVEPGVMISGSVTGLTEARPEWWGAIVDDTTDDTLALQAAADSLTGGGVVILSTGTYRLTSLAVDNPGTTIEGQGSASVLATTISAVTKTVPVVWVRASNFALHDFTVTWVTLPTALQEFNPINNNNTISIGWSEIAGTQTLIENGLIENVHVLGGKQHGIAVGRSRNISISSATVKNVYGTGIWTYYMSNSKIADVLVEDTKDDAIWTGSNGPDAYGPDDYAENNIISRIHINNAGAKGIGFSGSRNILIDDIEIDGTWANAILGKDESIWGAPKPVNPTVRDVNIRRANQNYGVGLYRFKDIQSTLGGTHAIVEIMAEGQLTLSNINITDDSGLQANYRAFWLSAPKIIMSGLNAKTDHSSGLIIGKDNPLSYTNVLDFSLTNSKIQISAGHGDVLLGLYGVTTGLISGNTFDCGQGTSTPPLGRFIQAWYAKDVAVTGNQILNCADRYVDIGQSSGFVFSDNTN